MKLYSEPDVLAVFDQYPALAKQKLQALRQLLLDTAKEQESITEIHESLKWNQPTYATKSGTPIRLGLFESDQIALFVHCQTTLIEDFRSIFGHTLTFSKNRAIVLDPTKALPINELTLFIEAALTYHQKKKP